MRVISTLFISFFCLTQIIAQKVCDTQKEDILEDFNSITKCSIEPSKKPSEKKTGQIAVRVSASKKRYLKKRSTVAKNTIDSNAIELNAKSDLSKSIKKNMLSFTNTLSKEEIKHAQILPAVDKIPAFDKCRNLTGTKGIDCFNEEMMSHINKHFKYPELAVQENIEGEVWVRFIIDKNGDVSNIKTLGPRKNGEILNQEAFRVVSKLPKFIPGEKDGKTVSVKYGFPINFSLNE